MLTSHDSILRFSFFVLGCIEVHKKNRQKQVEEILEVLHMNGIGVHGDNTNIKLPGRYALPNQNHPQGAHVASPAQYPLQELQGDRPSPQELPNSPAFIPEMAGDRNFAVEMGTGRTDR